MKVVFFGTPSFALPALDALALSRHKIVAAVSQPDRARDRKGRLLPTPVAEAAARLGLKLFQFESVKKEGIEPLKKLDADIFVTAAYGQLLSQQVLDIPRFGVINVHASLLPVYRGSSPVHHAVLNGDESTGVTVMKTRLALDSGEIILQEKTDINPEISAAELAERLSKIGARLLIEALDQIEEGSAVFVPQDEEKAVFCGKITPIMSKIDWDKSAGEINNLIRAVCGAAQIGGRQVKITKAAVLPDIESVAGQNIAGQNIAGQNIAGQNIAGQNIAGQNIAEFSEIKTGGILPSRRLLVKCGKGILEITALVPAGGKAMSGTDFLLGLKKGEEMCFE